MKALNGVSLSVEKGEFVAVVGTSGSGKSTLLHMLGGLDRPDSGKVYVDGKDIFSLKEEALTIFRRRKIGFVFQAYNLVPVLSVYENVVLRWSWTGKRRTGNSDRRSWTRWGSGKREEPSGQLSGAASSSGGHRAGPGGETGHSSVR